MRVTRLLASTACATALLASAGQLHAQSTEADNSDAAVAEEAAGEKESIVVTGSRIVRQGYISATPISTTTAEEMQAISPRILDAVQDLPQFSTRSSLTGTQSANTTLAGASPSTLSLRNLGPERNLILINGRRAPMIDDRALFDIALLSDPLIERVDVITGGASAAYGSDAISGAVNFILDTNYTGIKAEGVIGISDYGDGMLYKGDLTFGTPFADGRGHVVASVAYFHQDEIPSQSNTRDWLTRGRGTINSPAGVFPTRTRYESGVVSALPPGGRIISAPLAALNLTFDEKGNAVPYVPGTPTDGNSSLGGPGISTSCCFRPEQNRLTGFVHAEFELTPDHKLWVEASAAHSKSLTHVQSLSFNNPNPVTIFSDNAFLTPATKAYMTANNVTSFVLARPIWEREYASTVGEIKHYRGAVGIDGTISGDWTYAVHGQFARSKSYANYQLGHWRSIFAAVDAVVNPANGQIVCRSTLAGLDPGCVPLNLFGVGNISDAAWYYIRDRLPAERFLRVDDWNAGLSTQAPLFSLWSDPAILAAGYEYRHQSMNQTTDITSSTPADYTGLRGIPPSRLTTPGPFVGANYTPYGPGKLTVHEVFGELDVPIVRDRPMFHSLTLNGAVRYADYDPAGPVTSWKFSANYEPVPGLRLRGAVSRDNRAPPLFDLYQLGAPQGPSGQVNVPGVGPFPVLTIASGNLNLKPEKSESITYGAVLQPGFLPGLTLSVDRYHVKVKDAIGPPGGAQAIIDACRIQNLAESCAFLRFDAAQVVFFQRQINSQLLEIKGVDFEGSYTRQLGAGRFSIRALATYLESQTSGLPGAALVNRAGEVGNPKWRGTLRGSYSQGPFRMSLGARYLEATKVNVTWVEGLDINDNSVDSRTYFDTSIGYTIEDERAGEMELSLSVQNLLNSEPPDGGSGTSGFDTVGRFFNFSVKLRR